MNNDVASIPRVREKPFSTILPFLLVRVRIATFVSWTHNGKINFPIAVALTVCLKKNGMEMRQDKKVFSNAARSSFLLWIPIVIYSSTA